MSSQVEIEPMNNEFNQCFTLSHGENENNLNRMASSDILLYLNVQQIFRKFVICALGSSDGKSLNWTDV